MISAFQDKLFIDSHSGLCKVNFNKFMTIIFEQCVKIQRPLYRTKNYIQSGGDVENNSPTFTVFLENWFKMQKRKDHYFHFTFEMARLLQISKSNNHSGEQRESLIFNLLA